MKTLKALWMGLSMFCALPLPCPTWEYSLRSRMTALLGLVGVCIGGIWAGVAILCQVLSLPHLLRAAFIVLAPWLATGFIHLDGFMDCADAILSRRDLDERRRILKDSTCGAFSVIAFVCLALVSYGAVASWSGALPFTLVWIAVVPRCLSSLAVLTLPSLSSSQYNQVKPTPSILVTTCLLLLLALVTPWLYHPYAVICALASMAGWAVACGSGYHSLEGMSGDISGYAITIGEVCGLIALAML